jgi:hypothetical protein
MTDFEEFINLLERRGIAFTASWGGDFMEVKMRSSTHDGVVGDPGATTIFRFTQWGGLVEVENIGFTQKDEKSSQEDASDEFSL